MNQESNDRKIRAERLFKEGKTYEDSGDYPMALKFYNQSLEIIKDSDDKEIHANVLFRIGAVHDYQTDFPGALKYFRRSLEIYENLKDRIGESRIWRSLGITYFRSNEYQKSIECYEKCLDIMQELPGEEYRMKEIDVINNIGLNYGELSQLANAQKCYERTLTLSRKLKFRRAEAHALSNIGVIKFEKSEYQESLDYYDQSLKIYNDLYDKFNESIDLASAGTVLMRNGIVHRNLSNYKRALDYYQQSLSAVETAGDQHKKGEVFSNLGVCYCNLSDYDIGLEYFKRSLKISENLKDRGGELKSLNNLSGYYSNLGNHRRALEFLNRSLKLCNEIGEEGPKGDVLNNIGENYHRLLDYPKAFEFYNMSLKISEKLDSKKRMVVTMSNIGDLFVALGNYYEAETIIGDALKIALELKTMEEVRGCYTVLGNCYDAQGLLDSAADNYAEAIGIVEGIRSKLDVESHRTSYASGVSELYEAIVLSLLKLDREQESFSYVERSRARSYLDLLGYGKIEVVKNRHEDILRQIEDFYDKEDFGGQTLSTVEVADNNIALVEVRRKAKGDFDEFVEKKKLYEPELIDMHTVDPLTLSEVQKQLNSDVAVLEYYLTKDKTLIWLITKNNARVFDMGIGGENLREMVGGFRETIAMRGATDYLSRKLYALLIEPAIGEIDKDNLLVIPHGALHYLPFCTLQDPNGIFLLEKFKIRYLPSASVIKYLAKKRRDRGYKLLALGNPRTDQSGYEPLNFAEIEVNRIGELFKNSNIFIGDEASEARFKEMASSFDIIHVACHTDLNSAYPLFSCLLLTPGEDEDGRLEVHEIFSEIDLNAYLVVLSACETGLGRLTTGDELVGLSRSFIYVGTPSLISSLWRVDDESTGFLMQSFYKNLYTYDKGESLRRAQLDTKEKYKDIYNWAPFILIGDDA